MLKSSTPTRDSPEQTSTPLKHSSTYVVRVDGSGVAEDAEDDALSVHFYSVRDSLRGTSSRAPPRPYPPSSPSRAGASPSSFMHHAAALSARGFTPTAAVPAHVAAPSTSEHTTLSRTSPGGALLDMQPTAEEQRWLDEQLCPSPLARQDSVPLETLDALMISPSRSRPNAEEQAWLDRRISEARLLEQAEAWAKSTPSPQMSDAMNGVRKPARLGASKSYAKQIELLHSAAVKGSLQRSGGKREPARAYKGVQGR